MLSRPGALDGLIDLMTVVNSSNVKELQLMESSSDTLWLKKGVERSGPGRSSPSRLLKCSYQTFRRSVLFSPGILLYGAPLQKSPFLCLGGMLKFKSEVKNSNYVRA